jgi:hypothetical protein
MGPLAAERPEEGRRPYLKPEMKVEKIHRFFFALCQTTWPFCYSQHVNYPLQPQCR